MSHLGIRDDGPGQPPWCRGNATAVPATSKTAIAAGTVVLNRPPITRETDSSSPSPSSEESGANPALLRALLRHGTDLRITLARSDPISLAILDVLTKLLPPALFSNANLLCLTVCRAVNLSLEHGNSDGSCLCYEKCAALKFGALTDAVRFPGGHRRSVPR